MIDTSKLAGLEEYPGSKDPIVKKILNLIPPHEVYVEPFLGGGSVMRYKRPAALNVGNDTNWDVISRWERDGRFSDVSQFVFTSQKALDCITNHDFMGNVFFYLDPPYPMNSRSWQENLYDFEMSDPDHEELLAVILNLKNDCMISTYPNSMYSVMLKNWNKAEFRARTHRYTSKEIVYFNYPVPKKLHDYNYIGNDFYERQRIKRKIRRWTSKLLSMESRERHAIIEAVNTYEIDSEGINQKQEDI